MIRTVRIGSVAGLHARSAARVAATAAGLPVPVTVRKGDRVVLADSVLGLLSLAATYGTELTLEAGPPDVAGLSAGAGLTDGGAVAAALDCLSELLAGDLDAARA